MNMYSRRPQIWEFVTDIKKFIKRHDSQFYRNLIKCPSLSDKQIERDINRTYPCEPYFTNPVQ